LNLWNWVGQRAGFLHLEYSGVYCEYRQNSGSRGNHCNSC
jgi:hypothetical protein